MDGYILLYDITNPTKNFKQKIECNMEKKLSNLDPGNSVLILLIIDILYFKNKK